MQIAQIFNTIVKHKYVAVFSLMIWDEREILSLSDFSNLFFFILCLLLPPPKTEKKKQQITLV